MNLGKQAGAVYFAPRNWVLLVVFIGLLGTWLAGDGSVNVQQRAVKPLLESFRADQVRRVTLERPDPAASRAGGVERTTLQKTESGWQIAELYEARAFEDRVDRLLSRLGSMTTLDLVTEDAAKHGDYGLTEAKALAIRLDANEGREAPVAELLLAAAPGRSAWVRLRGDARVWRIARYSPPSAAPSSWFDDSSLISLQDNAIQYVKASGPAVGDPFQFAAVAGGGGRFRDGAGVDLPVPAVRDCLARLRMLFPLGVHAKKEPGAALPGDVWLSLEVGQLVGGRKFRVEIARPDASAEGGSAVRAARLDGSVVVTVATSTVEKIAESVRSLRESREKR